jgi:hypothetical protein
MYRQQCEVDGEALAALDREQRDLKLVRRHAGHPACPRTRRAHPPAHRPDALVCSAAPRGATARNGAAGVVCRVPDEAGEAVGGARRSLRQRAHGGD